MSQYQGDSLFLSPWITIGGAKNKGHADCLL